MEIGSLIGIGMVGAVLAVVLAQHRPEYAVLVSLGVGIVILYGVLTAGGELTERLEGYLSSAGIGETRLKVLLKSLGICFLSQLAADACRDVGQSAIAGKVELAGRMAVLLSALPLFGELLELAMKMISL